MRSINKVKALIEHRVQLRLLFNDKDDEFCLWLAQTTYFEHSRFLHV